jgi:hypothetical protein
MCEGSRERFQLRDPPQDVLVAGAIVGASCRSLRNTGSASRAIPAMKSRRGKSPSGRARYAPRRPVVNELNLMTRIARSRTNAINQCSDDDLLTVGSAKARSTNCEIKNENENPETAT